MTPKAQIISHLTRPESKAQQLSNTPMPKDARIAGLARVMQVATKLLPAVEFSCLDLYGGWRQGADGMECVSACGNSSSLSLDSLWLQNS